MKFKIAVAQFRINQIDAYDNLRRAEKFIKRAARSEAGIIIFPEYFVDGTGNGDLGRFDSGGKYEKYFQGLAKKYSIDIVAGSVVEKAGGKLYNVSCYIDSGGNILSKYKKINLWHTEKPFVSAGRELSVFDTRFGKAGLVICWDLFFPEMFRGMVERGVEIVLCPSYWRYEDAGIGLKYDRNSEIKLIDSVCVARAFENEIIFVYCSAAGRMKIGDSTDTLTGHSQIAVPFMGCIGKLAQNGEAMLIREVDTDILKDADRVYGIRKKEARNKK